MRDITKRRDVLTASEIAQYVYCSNAWYLQRKGYTPSSSNLAQGYEEHYKLGETIDNITKYTHRSKLAIILGSLVLILTILIILLEVVL
ncbi:MAG: hypothetical protein QXS02_00035 [Candidatus Thermoplasmatota archaeon]